MFSAEAERGAASSLNTRENSVNPVKPSSYMVRAGVLFVVVLLGSLV
jgi:hypothetical protein